MYPLKRYHFYYAFVIIYFILQLVLISFFKIFEDDENFKAKRVLGLYNKFLFQLRRNSFRDKTNSYRIVCLQCSETNTSTFDITLISQCSTDHIKKIEDLLLAWQGPLSVSVFTEAKDIKRTLWELTRFLYCKERKNLTLQVVMPTEDDNFEYLNETKLFDESIDELSFCKHQYYIEKRNYNGSSPYPINLLRNVAKSKSQTDYIMTVDIDLIPSINFHDDFLNYAKSKNIKGEKIAYVLPIFEIDASTTPPLTKENLIQQIKLKKARPFYVVPCLRCQKFTGYYKWLMSGSNSGTKVLYDVDWVHPWEPFYVAERGIPDFDERFKQYGMNRVSQICELYVAGYKFSVLDNVFLVHKGFKEINDFHSTKNIEMETNRKLYEDFKENLKIKYPKSEKTC